MISTVCILTQILSLLLAKMKKKKQYYWLLLFRFEHPIKSLNFTFNTSQALSTSNLMPGCDIYMTERTEF